MLTVGEAAVILGCSVQSVIRNIEKGRLPALDVGTGSRRFYRIKREDVDELKVQPAEARTPSSVRFRRSTAAWPFPKLLG
ncbi:MAG: helix-turn-helix domain-containing protein [Bacillota bacterium]